MISEPRESAVPGLPAFDTGESCCMRVIRSPGLAPVSQASSTEPFPFNAELDVGLDAGPCVESALDPPAAAVPLSVEVVQRPMAARTTTAPCPPEPTPDSPHC